MAVDLEVVCLSAAQGYIQTLYNDKWKPYLNLINTRKHIIPPDDHVTLLSMSRLHIEDGGNCYDVVQVYQEGVSRENRIWRVCGVLPPKPALVNARKIIVHFSSDRYTEFAGFRLLYSFHPTVNSGYTGHSGKIANTSGIAAIFGFVDAIYNVSGYYGNIRCSQTKEHQPVCITDNLWNCSVPEWPVFQIHYVCNLIRECDGGEDEAFCPYTGHCGLGFLTLDNRCYSYEATEHPFSWEEASYTCMTRGGHLASLNTPQEWDGVTGFLKFRQSARHVFVGLKGTSPISTIWYRQLWQWDDGRIAHYLKCLFGVSYHCGYFSVDVPDCLKADAQCFAPMHSNFLCEFSPEDNTDQEVSNQQKLQSSVMFVVPTKVTLPVPYVQCPSGHLTHDFLACDERSACWSSHHDYSESMVWGIPSRASCPAPMTSLPPMFKCSSNSQHVPYSLVCDHRQQCIDGSDELHCVFPPCSGSTPLQCLSSSQCVGREAFCDFTEDCVNHSDESGCSGGYLFAYCAKIAPPAVLTEVQHKHTFCSVFGYRPIANQQKNGKLPSVCPHTHFQCPDRLGYCLPSFLRCNGVADCPGKEDEEACDASSCPGFYRCRNSQVCLHVSLVCDGVYHCTEQDDELSCHSLSCPHNCSCHGLAFVCNGMFMANGYPELRYLNVKYSGMVPGHLSQNYMLIHLSLASCGLQVVEDFTFPNLRSLDLSDNLLSSLSIHHLREVSNLQYLVLSRNPLTSFMSSNSSVNSVLDHLESIDLSWLTIEEINWSDFDAFPNLRSLNLSHSTTRTLNSGYNDSCSNLRILDLRHSHLTQFQPDVLSAMDNLETVFTENYKLCCPLILPPRFNSKNCHSPVDPVSSCDNLLSSALQRVLLAVCSCFALLGNAVSVSVRTLIEKQNSFTSKDVLMNQLAVGDILMGICVAVVAVADRLYHGRYVLDDVDWRNSFACNTVGFLFLLSSQVCVSTVFLAAVDMLLSLRSAGRRLSCKSTHVVCVAVWLWCTVLAALPLLPTTASWEIFRQTSACIPLLTGQMHFATAAASTSTVAFLIINSLFVSFTAVILIFCHMAFKNTTSSNFSNIHNLTQSPLANRSDEVSYARRVFSSCVVSVVGWFPLCSMAALPWRVSPVLDELHVHVGVLALPVTSALRPFLHALGVNGDHRRRKRAKRLIALVAAQRRQKRQADTKPINRQE